ncbi:hypothetical protein KJ912_01215, partial [Patescibacteria group bacterium]|nr:hypothetical protein [Patescibacteria group bacterium]
MIFDYLKIFSAIIFFGVLPGFSILYLFIRPKFKLTAVEYMAFCVAISVTAVNFCVLFMDWLGISLSASHLMNAMFFVITIPLVASTFPSLKTTFMPVAGPLKKNKEPAPDFPSYLKPNKKQLIFSILIIGVSFFILTWFLAVDIVPNNTDLGHHMYWARQIADQERIVEYDTSDVIVGEHIIFAVVSKVTGISILSAFPVIILLLVGAAGFLAVVALALRVFRDQWIGWMAFLMIGVLYVAADPFGKFISGGVIGNTMGNLFIPLVLLSVYLAIKQRRSEFLALALFLFAGIFYIHHLSVFLLMFILLFGFLMYLGLGFLGKRAWKEKNKRFLKKIQRLGKLALNPLPI